MSSDRLSDIASVAFVASVAEEPPLCCSCVCACSCGCF